MRLKLQHAIHLKFIGTPNVGYSPVLTSLQVLSYSIVISAGLILLLIAFVLLVLTV